MLIAKFIGELLEVLLDVTAVALELSLDKDVTLLGEVDRIAGSKDIYRTDLTLADCLVMLLEH